METYSSSDEVNTNLIEYNGSIDLGQEFLSESTPEVTAEDTGVDGSAPICYPLFGQYGQPFVTCEGFVSLFVTKDIRVDINTNHSICVTTPYSKVSFDSFGHNIGLIHPFGRVYCEADQNNVHIESGQRLAKMSGRGVTFTSLNRSLIYLVDTSGCKTTTERFRKLSYDFTADIFHSNSLSGEYARQRAFADVFRHTEEVSENKTDKIWHLAGFRIKINCLTGELIINKTWKQWLQLNPIQNQVKINSPDLRIMASSGAKTCLQVIRPDPRDEQRVVVSFDRFQVKNGSQKAGFDSKDQLILM